MIKKILLVAITCFSMVAFTSCKNDDDKTDEKVDIPVADRNALDDEAIGQFLSRYYFNPINGRLFAKDEVEGTNPATGINDDDYVTLDKLAVKDPAGYWYALNPSVTAEGNSITSAENDSILISYDVKMFRATTVDTYKYKYGSVSDFASSLNGSGLPVYDPSFYYIPLTETQLEAGLKREHFELANFVEGLKHFKATNASVEDVIKMQGVVILPSRLAYARNRVYVNGYLTDQSYRDYSFVLTFNLHKILERKK